MNTRTKIAHMAALVLLPIAARGATMWLAGEGQTPSNTNPNNFIVCDIANSSSLGVNQANGCSGAVLLDVKYGAWQGLVASGAAQISAAATVGSLKTFAEADGTNLPHVQGGIFNLGSGAWAASSFQDMITVVPLIAPLGSPGFMQPVFSVQGPVSAAGSPLGSAAGVFVMTSDNFNSGEFGNHATDFASAANGLGGLAGFFLIDPNGVTANRGTAQGRTFTSTPIPIIFGTPHAFSAHLESFVSSCGNCSNVTPSQLVSFTGTADLSHTANLMGFIITDAGGHPLAGSSITGNGGFDYNSLGGSAAAPEPSSWVLAACAWAFAMVRTLRWRPSSARGVTRV